MDLIDPRIAEIMAKLNNKDTPQQTESKKKEEKKEEQPLKPPTTYQEFLATEKLRDWPHPLTSENPLDLTDEREKLGNKAMIEEELKQATPIDLHVLKKLESRLDKFDEVLLKYGRMVLELDKEDKEDDAKTEATEKENLPLSVPKDTEAADITELPAEEENSSVQSAFLTQMAESDAVKAHPSRKTKEKLEMRDSFAEVRKKSVEHCVFPGYFKGELTPLPAQLEAPHILHRVTKAQDFNSGFRKFWKKIFLSEASVAIMQDAFWWIFLENFQKKRQEDQSLLFDRIADSFVALFNSINPEIKDKVFMVYSDCLAQCIYAAFYEGFPESLRFFGDEFKQYLTEVMTTWVSGVRPPPGATKHWNVKRMLPKAVRHLEDPAMKSRREVTLNGPANPRLDMDDFMKQVDHLGEAPDDPTKNPFSKVVISSLPGYGEKGLNMNREYTKMTNFTAGVSKISGPVSNFPTIAQSRVAQIGTPPTTKRESHVIGPGAEIERVRFNLKGRSPLVAHYLHMHQLRDHKPAGGKVITRTEITKPPPSGLPTYRDLIRDTVKVQDALSKEYQKVCEETNQEILRIERQQRDTNRKIEKLQKQLMQCKNSMEIKIMSERILDKQDLDTNKLTLKESFDEDFGDSVNNSVNNSYSTQK